MSDPETPFPPDGQLMREAAAWFARMRGPDADVSRKEFERWLRRGALHRGAYNRAAEIFAMGKLLAEERPAPQARKRAWPPVALALASAALLALALMFLFAARPVPIRDTGEPQAEPAGRLELASASLSVPAGETRVFTLADGSTVTLLGGGLVNVRLDTGERRLALIQGRARFDVFKEARPFSVDAGGGRVTALGTRFEVAVRADRQVTVRLIEGVVDVSLPAKPDRMSSGAVRRLRAGMEVSFATPAGANSSTATAEGLGRAGRQETAASLAREFEAITVAELIAEANRRSSRPIRLKDPAIGRRQLSGRFRIDNSELLADRLAALLDLRVERGDANELLLRAR
jgi:transmembrane sensor